MVDNLEYNAKDDADDDFEDYNANNYVISGYDIQKVNAKYMRRMCGGEDEDHSLEGQGRVRFTGRVHVKFFDSERPPADVCDAQ